MAKSDQWLRRKNGKRNNLIAFLTVVVIVTLAFHATSFAGEFLETVLRVRFRSPPRPNGNDLPSSSIIRKPTAEESLSFMTSGLVTRPSPISRNSNNNQSHVRPSDGIHSQQMSISVNNSAISSLESKPEADSKQNPVKEPPIERSAQPQGSAIGGNAYEDVELELGLDFGNPPEKSMFSAPLNCEGKKIFMYNLPAKFNQQFLDNCATIHRSINMCEAFSHGGAGWPATKPGNITQQANGNTSRSGNSSVIAAVLPPKGAWFETDQFNLEIIFHARMKEYPCLTTNPHDATLFYIPFFPGLAIFRSVYEKNLTERDRHPKEVVKWLKQFPWWDRHQGKDHLLVITRVLIDFTRDVVRSDWGNTLLKQSHMRNCNILGIESHPRWAKLTNVHAIPYPTSFHPSNDRQIRFWQNFVRSYQRDALVAYMGVGHGFGANLRQLLWRECLKNSDNCIFYDCRNRVCIMKPQNVMWFYLRGIFCLQPPGDTPTRKGMFDCMLAGGIPVVFHDETAQLHRWHLPTNQDEVILYLPKQSSSKDASEVIPLLKSISKEKIARMQAKIVEVIPHLAYAMPGNTIQDFRDAFTIAIENTLKIVSKLKLSGNPRLPEEYL